MTGNKNNSKNASSANTDGGKAKTIDKPPILCIRCPSREDAEKLMHENDFSKCFAAFPNHSAKELWWGFLPDATFSEADNPILVGSGDDKTPSFENVEAVLKKAKKIGQLHPIYPTGDTEIQERDKKADLLEAKAEGKEKLDGVDVDLSKELLEFCARADLQEVERKRAEKEAARWRKKGMSGGVIEGAGLIEAAGGKGGGSGGGVVGTGDSMSSGAAGTGGGGKKNGDDDKAGKGKRPADTKDQPRPSIPTLASRGTSQPRCLRCPADSAYHQAHANNPDGLLQCWQDISFGTAHAQGRTIWPGLTADRSSMSPATKATYDRFSDRLHGAGGQKLDHGLASELYEALKAGHTRSGSVPFTPQMAERVVQLVRERRQADSSGEGGNAGATPKLNLPTAHSSIAPSSTTFPASAVASPAPGNQATNSATRNQLSTTTPLTARMTDAKAPTIIRGPHARVDFAPNLRTSPAQRTDQVAAQAYINTVATRLFMEQQHHLTNAPTAQAGSTPTASDLERIKKQFGLRTAFAKPEPQLAVETNYLTMKFPSTIYVYNLELVRETQTNGKELLVAKQADKLIVVETIKGQTPGSTFFQLGNPANVDSWVRISFNRTLDLTQPVGDLWYDATTATWDDSTPGILQRGLNAFFTRFVRNNTPQFYTRAGLNKSFSNAAGEGLDTNGRAVSLRAMRGYFLSTRAGTDSMYLNINTATSPFFENLLVTQLLNAWLGGVRPRRNEPEVFKALVGAKVMLDYPVNDASTAFPTPTSRYRFIQGFYYNFGTRQNPNWQTPRARSQLMNRNRYAHPPNGVTVQDWYSPRSVYRHAAEYPKPSFAVNPGDYVVNLGKNPDKYPGEDDWYPLNELRIVQWQPFRGGSLEGEQTAEMIRVALQQPENHRAQILSTQQVRTTTHSWTDGDLEHFGFAGQWANNDQAGLEKSSMKAGTQFLQIPARWVTTPRIGYRAGSSKTPASAAWDLRDMSFLITPSPALQTALSILNVSGHTVTSGHANHIRDALRSHGLVGQSNASMQVINQTLGPYGSDQQYEGVVENLLTNYTNPRLPTLIVIPEKSYDIYSVIKRAAELRLGRKTICITFAAISRKDRVQRLDRQTASNVAIKYNLKSEGICHEVNNADLSLLRTQQQCDTIVIGADVAHPTAAASKGCPSVASVVGSTDNRFMHFPGSMRLQRSRKEDIVEMAHMVKERIIDWSLSNRNKIPAKMLFYRDGVSDSQYDIVRRREIPELQLAVNLAYNYIRNTNSTNSAPTVPPPTFPPRPNGKDGKDQKMDAKELAQAVKTWEEQRADIIENLPGNIPFDLTFVVVGKRHSTRFYATNKGDHTSHRNANLKPGLAVDQVITHPYMMDFYLQSHQAIQGTARSAHYIVLRNNMALPIEKMQSITNGFCYSYAKATKGVSYCAPAYYADRLCDRGRAYLRHWLLARPTYSARAPHTNQQGRRTETDEEYNDFVRDSIYNSVYWRPYMNPASVPPQKYGMVRQNPWQPSLDNTMFYL
ncbi:hypothetical protein LTR86_005954 [Recurvomyces mirabilis]|nr:hypothetical protein LTR86_005954 [Recurvomyces mirabilis]